MMILVSGEGVGDMGCCVTMDPCVGDDFKAGPMAYLVEQIADSCAGYPFLSSELMSFVSKQSVVERGKTLRPPKLPGAKSKKETAFFYRNARAMARLAKDLAEETNDEVVAVLFRDADRTRSTGRGEWQDKWDSMIKGFAFEGFDSGVPMVPNPKSEAWLLCALKTSRPYQHCGGIEAESGNDDAPNSLKGQLENALGCSPNAETLAGLVRAGKVDAKQIDMPSFIQFRKRLQECLCPWEWEIKTSWNTCREIVPGY